MGYENLSDDELQSRANAIRRGEQEDPQSAFDLAKLLAKRQYLDEARRLAKYIKESASLAEPLATELYQRWAYWTSKNPDDADDTKHDEALAILEMISRLPGGEPLATTTNSETLGIAGGICKRRWIVEGQLSSLIDSLKYYERGVALGIEKDNGYTAINAAFVHDLLANFSEIEMHKARSKELRKAVLSAVLPLEDKPWRSGSPLRREVRWFTEIVAEAYFGLGEYDKAVERLAMGNWQTAEPWELEAAARQFAWLAHLQDPNAKTKEDLQKSLPWQAIAKSFGSNTINGADSLFAGKLGLALSGGGFRASFFHIGVLAAMAELDILKHVEVLSCVSGGSILGAYYYLEVRQLLQAKSDDEITRQDYINLVERIAKNFREGVQRNIRTRVATKLWADLKMMLVPGYTRTTRLAELYESQLYDRISDGDEHGKKNRKLRELLIRPKGDPDIKPKYENWRRRNKVPILILNATCLNSGHNWQFTASGMGEPPNHIDSDVDGNDRYRRMRYSEAPKEHQDVRIGLAVAASSCVPGLFGPVELSRLYKDGDNEITVRLVDGGVHDNQGIFGLLDQNCNNLIISDASGQMSSQFQPSASSLGALFRTTSIQSSRVRTVEYRELEARVESLRIKSLLFLHLKKDLQSRDIDWIDCQNPKETTPEELAQAAMDLTSYGILKSAQASLANIRTDLDSFSDAEIRALIVSGYKMTKTDFRSQVTTFPLNNEPVNWSFLDFVSLMKSAEAAPNGWLGKTLKAASERAFKIWHLSSALRVTSKVIGFIAILSVAVLEYLWHSRPVGSFEYTFSLSLFIVVALVVGILAFAKLSPKVGYRKPLAQFLFGIFASSLGFVFGSIHVWIFDKLFLRNGRFPKDTKDEPTGSGR